MAKDFIHDLIKTALENAGWKITSDPLTIELEEDNTYFDIDLGAEKTTLFFKETVVAIEVKSFRQASVINSFHEALGQFLNYQAAIEEQALNLELFLAVSEEGWDKLNAIKFIQRRILQYGLRFLVVNIHSKTISKWIK
ncbi:MAG: element excision factor XisH family protein [Bacteroidota bacterium]|mgnify:CR=1 FL=1